MLTLEPRFNLSLVESSWWHILVESRGVSRHALPTMVDLEQSDKVFEFFMGVGGLWVM